MSPRLFTRSHAATLAAVAALSLTMIACGGDDEAADAVASANSAPEAANAAAADALGQASDAANEVAGAGGVVNSLADAMGDDAASSLNDAIDAIGDEGMMNIVAGQLGEGTTVEIKGSNVTFTIPSGTNEGADPISDCIIIKSFADEASTVKVVYPDGETTC